ncbi:MAG: hypothetical protein IPF66_25225 [Holophagales bacterium]|nr:hypothetical protein [Holophagales bacterium]
MRLQAGKAEAAAGRHYDAIDDFRIASFGFIDQPALLIEGLTRLALVQEAAGRKDDSEATLRRLVEIERRFHGWAQADLEPETRAAFSHSSRQESAPRRRRCSRCRWRGAAPAPTPEPVTPGPTAAPTAASGVPSAATLAESKALVAQGRYVENRASSWWPWRRPWRDRELRKALIEGAP